MITVPTKQASFSQQNPPANSAMDQSDDVSVDSQDNEDTNDTSYESGCESGSSVSTCASSNNMYQTRPKKKSRNMINLTELEVDMRKAIAFLTNENNGPTVEDCHEKLKGLGLKQTDPMFLAAFTYFGSKTRREAWMALPSEPEVLKAFIKMWANSMGIVL